ncbi:MAG: hypothetical protein HC834_04340, partial [Rhodospirillales bacterium]|nr:hypothetical protein [Rhodospirillales bacterium]
MNTKMPASTPGSPAAPLIQHVITGLDIGGAEMMLCRLIERAEPSRSRHAVLSLRGGGALRDVF